jgi:hypothetical protein
VSARSLTARTMWGQHLGVRHPTLTAVGRPLFYAPASQKKEEEAGSVR